MAGKAIGSATSVDLRPGAEALKQLPDATGDASELSAKFSKDEAAIKNTQVAQNKSRPPEEWTGAAADAASDEIQKLGTKTEQLAEPFRGASAALNEWATNLGSWRDQIKTLQSDWDSAIAKYHKDVAAAGPDPAGQTFISAPGAPVPSNQEAIAEYNRAIKSARRTLHSAQEGFKTTYTGYLTKCSDDAQSAADKINNARRDVVSDQAGAGGRDAVGASLFLPSELPTVSGVAMWAHAQEVAPEIAEDLKKQPKTVEEVKAFNEKWGDLLGNPFYANALSQYVTVDDIYNASLDALGAGDGRSPRPGSNPGDSVYLFNKNLGTLLAMSTGGTNLSGATAGAQVSFDLMSDHLTGKDGVKVSELVQTKLDQLKEAGWKTYSIPGYPEDAQNAPQYMLQGYEVFGQLAGYAARENPALTLGAGFYEDPAGGTSVFTDMVKWDHDTNAGVAANSNFAGHAANMSLIPFTQTDADKGHYDPLQSVFELSDTPDTLEAHNNPHLNRVEEYRLEKLRNALTSDVSFDVTVDVNGDGEPDSVPPDGMMIDSNGDGVPDQNVRVSIARYLAGSRLGTDARYGYYDGGEAFGNMINDASRRTDKPVAVGSAGYKEWLADDEKRAKIAGDFLTGYQDGLDQNSSVTYEGQDTFGYQNSKMRWWAGTVAAEHVDDLAELTEKAQAGGNPVETHPRGASGYSRMFISPANMRKMFASTGLFTDLAHDQPRLIQGGDTIDTSDDVYEGGRPPALQALGDKAWAGYKYELKQAVNGEYDSDWQKNVQSRSGGWRTLVTALDSAPVQANVEVDKATAERNLMVRGLIDYTISKVPLEKLPLGALLKVGASAGLDSILDAHMPTDMTKQELTQHIRQDLLTTQNLNDAIDTAFIERDEWPNKYGKTKAQLLDEFAETKGYDTTEKPLPSYADMDATQRKDLVDFLTEKEKETDSNARTHLDLIHTASTAADADIKTFLEQCNNTYASKH